MPKVFKVGPYLIYFWVNEGSPPEPVHVHVTSGTPAKNDTKIWITRAGGCIVEHNNGDMPSHRLREIIDILGSQSAYITKRWEMVFGAPKFYC